MVFTPSTQFNFTHINCTKQLKKLYNIPFPTPTIPSLHKINPHMPYTIKLILSRSNLLYTAILYSSTGNRQYSSITPTGKNSTITIENSDVCVCVLHCTTHACKSKDKDCVRLREPSLTKVLLQASCIGSVAQCGCGPSNSCRTSVRFIRLLIMLYYYIVLCKRRHPALTNPF